DLREVQRPEGGHDGHQPGRVDEARRALFHWRAFSMARLMLATVGLDTSTPFTSTEGVPVRLAWRAAASSAVTSRAVSLPLTHWRSWSAASCGAYWMARSRARLVLRAMSFCAR